VARCGAIPRHYKDHLLPAESGPSRGHAPDQTYTWPDQDGKIVTAHLWINVFLSQTTLKSFDTLTAQQRQRILHTALNVAVIVHPDFKTPWLLCIHLPAVPRSNLAHAAYAIFHDRWPIETLPQTSKQLLGAQRQFVYAQDHPERLAELALLAGNALSLVAASADPIPTGFWDSTPNPRRTGAYRPLVASAALYTK